MSKWRELGITEFRELKKLREQTLEATYEPETPEHKVSAWDGSETDKNFGAWSPIYHRNIKNSSSGLGREADFREALDNGNGLVASRVPQTARGPRQVDAATPDVYIQLKSGSKTSLTRERQGGQLTNLEAIQRDRLLDKPVVWVVEGKATPQLRDMLNGIDPPNVKLKPPQGPKVQIELFEGPGAYEAAVTKYRLPPKKGS